ncbi:hypothetical protein [Brevundimonas sp.]|uniref:hypothetical protein n=1 Tax=Brevundimonas sp. TaxID=1871086 RepID=UPI003D0B8402
MIRHALVVVALISVAGCATAPEATVAGPPDFSPIQTQPHPRARLFVDCIAQATAAGAYGHAHDGDSDRLLFTCNGAPARAFYDGLATRSATIGSEVQANGRTFRTTEIVERDLFGVDYCSTGGANDFTCIITLNTGAALVE